MKRRAFLSAAGGATAAAFAQTPSSNVPEAIRNLKPMTAGVQPITDEERRARIEKARRLMHDNKLGGVYMESGSSMFYFTGTRRAGSAVLIPRTGELVWFGDDRPADPKNVVQAVKDRTLALGLEEQVHFGVYDGLRKEAPAMEFALATPVTAGCRMIKSPAEIALMQHATDVTIAAYRAGLATLREGMTQYELSSNIGAAYQALGYRGEAAASFGKYTAFPHGSIQPQQLREGDIVLIDDGCSVDGYQSDVTRSLIFGKPTARQLQIWNLERKAQNAALAAAKPGAACESVDAAARKVITDAGFGPDYKVPGLPHRTGHGIGLDIHEWTYLVRGNKTRLAPGMCFSDEPMIAIYGEFGIRLEDCFYMTENGPRTFSRQSPAIDQPFG
jgi:Xaa-Pro dipeptidase